MEQNKVPTVAEFLNEKGYTYGEKCPPISIADAKDLMKEFAWMHVLAALEISVEKARVVFEEDVQDGIGIIEESSIEVDRESILNAYSPDNIQ